ncbi:MAG TPA: SDR family oxidoreductase [Steroidobacteraceae bacterium]|nr:SDR family oxidoreductase [Steroidobacteraceae bacterium]
MKRPARYVALLALVALALTAHTRLARADTVLITGANSGIGLEFAKEYAARGWTVIATHRHDTTPATLAVLAGRYRKVRVERMDVTDASQIQALARKLGNVPIDVLINNAGVYNDRGNWRTQDFGRLDFALMDTIMAVNVKGPLMVTEAFIANVRASREKKIINISSTNGSLTRPLPGDGAIFYRASKAALNREMQLVARALKGDGVIVVLMHPGAVLTERQAYLRGKYPGMVEMPFTVHHMIDTIAGLTLKDTGRFMLYDGSTVPW